MCWRWCKLLDQMHHVHAMPELLALCELPSNLLVGQFTLHHAKAADAMFADTGLSTDLFTEFQSTILSCSAPAQWLETHRNTAVGADFLDRFGCCEIADADSPFVCGSTRDFAVHVSAEQRHTCYDHPVEKLHLIIAGIMEFAIGRLRPERFVSVQRCCMSPISRIPWQQLTRRFWHMCCGEARQTRIQPRRIGSKSYEHPQIF